MLRCRLGWLSSTRHRLHWTLFPRPTTTRCWFRTHASTISNYALLHQLITFKSHANHIIRRLFLPVIIGFLAISPSIWKLCCRSVPVFILVMWYRSLRRPGTALPIGHVTCRAIDWSWSIRSIIKQPRCYYLLCSFRWGVLTYWLDGGTQSLAKKWTAFL